MSQPTPEATGRRLVELDGLRGIAAISVLLFHFTTRYDVLFGHQDEPMVSFPKAFLGVELFFIISGFVILMTISRTETIWDFIASRFGRLFPAYWVAIVSTLLVLSAASLWPEGQPTIFDIALNFTMLQQFVGAQNIDGVYWTLYVELMFYALIAGLFLTRLIRHVEGVAFGLVVASIVDWVLIQNDFPATPLGGIVNDALSLVLVDRRIEFFVTGMMLYLCWKQGFSTIRLAVVALGVASTLLTKGWEVGIAHACFALIVALAASGLLPPLRSRPIVFLGFISYTLYLVHQYIGYAIMHELQSRGLNSTLSIIVATGVAVGLATILSVCVERPANAIVRTAYRRLKNGWQAAPIVIEERSDQPGVLAYTDHRPHR